MPSNRIGRINEEIQRELSGQLRLSLIHIWFWDGGIRPQAAES